MATPEITLEDLPATVAENDVALPDFRAAASAEAGR
jgi:hypothetical protein